MVTVGVRELRQRASELLRLVERGESVEITDHGRPVAVLGPIPRSSRLDRLNATGATRPATGNLAGLPLPLASGDEPLPSEVLADLRRDER